MRHGLWSGFSNAYKRSMSLAISSSGVFQAAYAAANFVGTPAEQGNGIAVLIAQRNVVNAGTPAAAALFGGGGDLVAQLAGAEVVDTAASGHGGFIVAVAGKRKGGIGEGKQKPAMAVAVPLHHVLTHGHGQFGEAGATRVIRMPSPWLAWSRENIASAQASASCCGFSWESRMKAFLV